MTPTASSVAGAGPSLTDDGSGAAVLKLYLSDTQQLFNSMDPAPFRERDLDPKAADYIVDWAQEAPTGRPLRLVIHLGRKSIDADDAQMLREAVQEYYRGRAVATRTRLRKLFRVGRISLVIGVACLSAAIGIGEYIGALFSKARYSRAIEESMVIGGWVALWHPMGIFLYEWWPIVAEARLYDRLSTMDVSVYSDATNAPAGAIR